MQGLSRRQEICLELVRESIRSRGYPPTLREIGERMGIRSTNGVNDHLRSLERKGLIAREDMKSRGIKLLESEDATVSPAVVDSNRAIEVPVVDRIQAHLPLLAEEHVIDHVLVDRILVKGGRDVFGLRVIGDSMIDAGIFSGDYVFVRRQSAAERGDIVCALIGDEATVKRFYPERDYVSFRPANAKMAPVLVRSSDFRSTMLLGKVVGSWRRF